MSVLGNLASLAGAVVPIVSSAAAARGPSVRAITQNVSGATDALSRIQGITESNTARSMAEAANVREWQEAQNAKAMAFSQREAEKQRAWQKMMSDTSHQREMADLKASGLNPVLAVMGGQGASTPSGSSASGVTSSGASGEVDKSLSSAMVDFLATIIDNQNQLMRANITATNNLAVADKYNNMSHIVAQLNNANAIDVAKIHAAAGIRQSSIAADATRYAAEQSRAAAQYGADVSYAGLRDFPNNGWRAAATVINDLIDGGKLSGAAKGVLGSIFSHKPSYAETHSFPRHAPQRSGARGRG